MHQAKDLVGQYIDLGDLAGGRMDAPGDEPPRTLVDAPQRGFNFGSVVGVVELHREEQLDGASRIFDHRLPAIDRHAEPLGNVAPLGLAGFELVQSRFGDRLDDDCKKSLLAAEVLVDGRRLHLRPLADLADRLVKLLDGKATYDFDQARKRRIAARDRGHRELDA